MKYLPVAHLLYYTNGFLANVVASGTSYPAYPKIEQTKLVSNKIFLENAF